MVNIIGLFILLFAILVTWAVFKFIVNFSIKRFLMNSIAGLISMYILSMLGIHIPINWFTVILVGLTGFVGLLILIILALLGIPL